MRTSLYALAFLLVAGAGAGCGSDERKITAEEEKMYRNPPKEPPAGYKGNAMGTPPAAPSNPSGG